MKVILGCDPLLQPLTGIGHYTQRLSKGLLETSSIEELKLFAHGKFFDSSLIDTCIADPINNNQHIHLNFFGKLRSSLAKSQTAVKVYSLLSPLLNNLALKNHQDSIFHSPNFILPNFEGKKVVTIHDLSTVRFPEYHPKARVNYVNTQLERSLNQADHIITDSEFIKAELIDMFPIAKNKVSAIHLGADAIFQVRPSEQCSSITKFGLEYKKFFLFVSTIEPRKNIEKLLSAFCLYRENNPNGFPLILVGSKGWNDVAIQNIIEKLTRKGWVKHLGYVAQSDIPILYSSAKALLFPSIYEGFGLPVLEALQSGTPVLTGKNSSMSEITQKNAALVDVNDVDNMAKLIERLDTDDVWSLKLIEGGLNRAKDFSWKKCIHETLEVYKSLN